MDASWVLRLLLAILAIVVILGFSWPRTAAWLLLWFVTFSWWFPYPRGK